MQSELPDIADALEAQRNDALNANARNIAIIKALERRVAELESQIEILTKE